MHSAAEGKSCPFGEEAVPFIRRDSGVSLIRDRETLVVEAWGRDTIRVQAAIDGGFAPVTDALATTEPSRAHVEVDAGEARVRSGDLEAVVSETGHLAFFSSDDTEAMLQEPAGHWLMGDQNPQGRTFTPQADGAFRVTSDFEANQGERFYGLGQHQLERLDLKGAVIDLRQRNAEVSVPVILSSRGYGFFWNDPSLGRVELAGNRTRWVAERTAQLDYFVYRGDTPADILARYYDLTGYPRPIPQWTTGFWQSKTRYRSQAELLSVAREHWRLGLPLAVMKADFFHSSHMGDWDWDPELWPDPAGMVAELAAHDCKLMVSIWPHINPKSVNFERARDAGWLVRWSDGSLATFAFADLGDPYGIELYLLDVTNPEARGFLWSEVKRLNHDLGVRAFWLDACEPELTATGLLPRDEQAHFHRGPGASVASLFPYLSVQAFREGLDAAGDEDTALMVRSAWAGSQRLGAMVWSGDTLSSWESLGEQVRAGLNMMLSGIPWWNSDIGGFVGGDINDEGFRELLVRWFQFGVFCPIVRLHGLRSQTYSSDSFTESGDDNEVWSFGQPAFEILKGLLFFRERLRPYVAEQFDLATRSGVPPMRPLWFDDPADAIAADVEDQFLFGPDLLVAPVLEAGATERRLYLPRGSAWTDPWTGERHPGGSWRTVEAPLQQVPFLVRDGARLEIDRGWFAAPPAGEDTA
jgi:alpha-D-xyloside xylohydrolase